jgi:hypothetical protein
MKSKNPSYVEPEVDPSVSTQDGAAQFVPSTQWQDIPEWAAIPPGGEYRFDIATGKSQARWDNPPGPETVVDKRKLPKRPPDKAEVAAGPPPEDDLTKIAARRQKVGQKKIAQQPESDPFANGEQAPSPEDRKKKLREKYKDLKSKTLAEATTNLPPELITGILLQRRRLLICGVSFGRKTWLCMLIAFCLSKGLALFGKFKTLKIPVLYANLELLEASAKRRFMAIAKALNYEGDPFENLRIISSTEFTDIIENDFAEFLALQASDDKVKAVCIDPLWRLLGERDENSVTGIGQVLKPFAKFSREADASAIATHHFAKGNAASKDPIDRASGSGALSRDAATQLTLSGHKETDAYTIDIATNDFIKPDKFCVRFNYPIFELAPDLDPNDLKQPARPVGEQKKGLQQLETILSVLYARDYDGGLRHREIVRFTAFAPSTITKILKAETKAKERIVTLVTPGEKRVRYALAPWYRTKPDREIDEFGDDEAETA